MIKTVKGNMIKMSLFVGRFWYYTGAVLHVIEKFSKICKKVFTNVFDCDMIISSNK